jgi:acyl carrier protein
MSVPAAPDEDTTRVLRDIVVQNSGVDRELLSNDVRIADLGLDSIVAAEILSQAELALGVEIDSVKVLGDWSTLTVAQLVAALRQAAPARGLS